MQDSSIDGLVRERWDAWYERHIGNAATDQEELRRIREYRQRAEAGFTLTESGGEAKVGRPRWTVATAQALAGDSTAQAPTAARRRLVLALCVVMALVMCGVLALILTPLMQPKRAAAAKGQATSGPLPTAAPVLVEVDGQHLALDAPRSLEMQGVVLQVVPGEVTAGGGLKYPKLEDQMVVWFPSPANWLVGADARVVEALDKDQVIVGRTATGRVLRFIVDSVRTVHPQEVEALAQGRAGLVVFPLASTGQSVRIVSARYDPTSEQPDAAGAAGTTGAVALGQPVLLPGARLVVAGTQVERRKDGLYQITVQHVSTGTLPPAMLSIDGQLYPQAQGLTQSPGALQFYVASLGMAELVVSDQHVALGSLDPPQLAGEITGVSLTPTDLVVTVTVTATRGGAYLLPGDITLLTGVSASGSGQQDEVSALQVTPVDAYLTSGASTEVGLHFARPQDKTVRIRVFDTLWEVTGLAR